MVLTSGSLNRRIQIQRAVQSPDGHGGFTEEWADHGAAIFAQRRDVSDAERISAGVWDNRLVTRFTIRATAFGRGVYRSDRIVHEGVIFEIDGIKEVPGQAFLEITAQTDGIL